MRARRWSVPCLVWFGLLTGCEDPGDPSTLEIRPGGPDEVLADSLGLAGLRLVVGREVITPDRFVDVGGYRAVRLTVPDEGVLELFAFLEQSDRIAAQGSVRWELRPDFEWSMFVARAVEDHWCIGICRVSRFELEPWAAVAPGESLWLVHSGSPRGSDVVY